MMKMAAVLFAFAVMASGCGETTTDGGSGGEPGTAGSGGEAGDGGSGGSAGTGGTGGSGVPADVEAEYRTACLRDEPDTPIDCRDRKLEHYERQCGDLHLDWTVCMNDLDGNDPFDDCGPLLDDWNSCFEAVYPAYPEEQPLDVECRGGTWVEQPRNYTNDESYWRYRWRYWTANSDGPPNPGARRVNVAVCNVALDGAYGQNFRPCYAEGDSNREEVPCSDAMFADFNEVAAELRNEESLPKTAPGCADAAIMSTDGALVGVRCGFEFEQAHYGSDSGRFSPLAATSWKFVPSVVRMYLTERTEAP